MRDLEQLPGWKSIDLASPHRDETFVIKSEYVARSEADVPSNLGEEPLDADEIRQVMERFTVTSL